MGNAERLRARAPALLGYSEPSRAEKSRSDRGSWLLFEGAGIDTDLSMSGYCFLKLVLCDLT